MDKTEVIETLTFLKKRIDSDVARLKRQRMTEDSREKLTALCAKDQDALDFAIATIREYK